MYIISKFKDYYDWVVFETDNRKIYNRNTIELHRNDYIESEWKKIQNSIPFYQEREYKYSFNNEILIRENYLSSLAICSKIHIYLYYENKIYWEYDKIPDKVKEWVKNKGKWMWSGGVEPIYKQFLIDNKLGLHVDNKTQKPILTKINEILNCPVILNKARTIICNPNLTDIGFNKVVPPTEMYQDIYNFIPYNEPELPGSPDDMNRYEAKGFDKKTSFRPKIKIK